MSSAVGLAKFLFPNDLCFDLISLCPKIHLLIGAIDWQIFGTQDWEITARPRGESQSTVLRKLSFPSLVSIPTFGVKNFPLIGSIDWKNL
jgi:hypothetical protein